jgi:riboflavin biosynthesis pyrimidine reductase
VQHLDELSDDELADLYAYPGSGDRAVVRANFVSTLDGSATGDDGRSGSINDDADHRVFAALRALCDTVLIGAGTARDEGYGRLGTPDAWAEVREANGLAQHPLLVLVSRSLELPEKVLDDVPEAGGLLVLTTEDADPLALAALTERIGPSSVLQSGRGSVDLVSATESLAGRGLRRILCEGGPQLMNDLARAELVDELCLTVAPLLVGGHGPRISAGAPLRTRMRLAHALRSDGSLLTRWTRR